MLIADCQIVTLYDVADRRLKDFRRAIFEHDLAVDPSLLSATHGSQWWIINHSEDAYKYSDKKWMEVGFDAIETVIENDKIVCMSGAKVYEDVDYNRFLRVNMFYYILKAHRAKYNGIVYLDQGFFDRHINFAKATRCKGLFFSIYAHSSKLKAMVINHTTRRISSVRSKLKHWDNLQHLGQCQFNNVQQEFFYFPLSIKTFNPSRLIT